MASVNSFSGTQMPIRSSYTGHVTVMEQEGAASSHAHKNEGKLHERKFPETRLIAKQAAEKTVETAPGYLKRATKAVQSETGKAVATGIGVGVAAILLRPLQRHNLILQKKTEEGVKHSTELLFTPAKETMKLKFAVVKELVMSPVKWGIGAIGAAAAGLMNKSTPPVIVHMPHAQNSSWKKFVPFV